MFSSFRLECSTCMMAVVVAVLSSQVVVDMVEHRRIRCTKLSDKIVNKTACPVGMSTTVAWFSKLSESKTLLMHNQYPWRKDTDHKGWQIFNGCYYNSDSLIYTFVHHWVAATVEACQHCSDVIHEQQQPLDIQIRYSASLVIWTSIIKIIIYPNFVIHHHFHYNRLVLLIVAWCWWLVMKHSYAIANWNLEV